MSSTHSGGTQGKQCGGYTWMCCVCGWDIYGEPDREDEMMRIRDGLLAIVLCLAVYVVLWGDVLF